MGRVEGTGVGGRYSSMGEAGAVGRTVRSAVGRAVGRAVDRAVGRAVDWAVDWAVGRACGMDRVMWNKRAAWSGGRTGGGCRLRGEI